MRIKLERTGGFAGLRLERVIDSDQLPASEARHFESLLRKSRFFELPAELKSPAPGADRLHYRLTIETEEGARTVEASEAAVPVSLRHLLTWIEKFSQ